VPRARRGALQSAPLDLPAVGPAGGVGRVGREEAFSAAPTFCFSHQVGGYIDASESFLADRHARVFDAAPVHTPITRGRTRNPLSHGGIGELPASAV
jgi:hypothetical protein